MNEDRISVKREFRRVLWTCPFCLQEDYQDRKVSGGDEYVHVCSKCGKSFNQSGNNMKEYNGCLSYTLDEYSKVKEKDISNKKNELMARWVKEIKNPQVAVKPTKENLRQMKKERLDEADRIQRQIDEVEV
jgi:predicted  nucleic acid-binding Zn-ribbon protein